MSEDCQICLSQAAKYTCPKCRVKTCSLPCVQSHKKLQSCDGKRDKAGYIAKKKYDMACLTSDYCFLEDVSRAADNATRDNANSPSLVHANTLHKPARPLSYMQHLLTKECRSRGTTVKFMSAGMKRHDANQSMYRKKDQTICWTVEWTFVMGESAAQIRVLDARVDETCTLKAALERLLADRPGNTIQRHNLKKFCSDSGDHSVSVKLLQEDIPVNERMQGSGLDTNLTLRQVLQDKTVIEMPRFIVEIDGTRPATTIQ
ncbi:Box C/D snoRNA accumulation [Batrachochytrium dendrobatidis]